MASEMRPIERKFTRNLAFADRSADPPVQARKTMERTHSAGLGKILRARMLRFKKAAETLKCVASLARAGVGFARQQTKDRSAS